MNKRLMAAASPVCVALFAAVWFGLLRATEQTNRLPVGKSGKIPLDPSMILEETYTFADERGGVQMLLDEQQSTGDPLAGKGGAPQTSWHMGTGFLGQQTHDALLDLGGDYELSNLSWYSSDESQVLTVSTGVPFHWNEQFAASAVRPNEWKGQALNRIVTRYVRLRTKGDGIKEIALYGKNLGTNAAAIPKPASHVYPDMASFIGVNANIIDPVDYMAAAGSVREYHNWRWNEGDKDFGAAPDITYPGFPNNQIAFNPSSNGFWNFDAFYTKLHAMGLTASPVVQGTVSWLSRGPSKPLKDGGDPLDPRSYIAHAGFMYQMAARYGDQATAPDKLKLAPNQPRLSGLGLLKYYEDQNEGDAWWEDRNVYSSPYEYAAMASADYDGHRGSLGAAVGVKNADPQARMVMMGLADPNLDYIKGIKRWADEYREGSFPADVLNVHIYCNSNRQHEGSHGISPEDCKLKERMEQISQYRDRYLPGKEFWVSEFGYDTNEGSVQRTPAVGPFSAMEVQAQWLVRSYLALAAAGVDKAYMFMLSDTDPNSSVKFNSSGLIGPKGDNSPKPSWFYVYTMKNRLAGLHYSGEQQSNDPNVRVYRYADVSGKTAAYAVWSPTSSNTKVEGFHLLIDRDAAAAALITPTNGSTRGDESALPINRGYVKLDVSENPQYVLVHH